MCWLVSAKRLPASALTVRPPTIVPGAAARAAAHSARSQPGLGQAVVVGERQQLALRRARAGVAGGAGPAALAPQQPDRQPAGRPALEASPPPSSTTITSSSSRGCSSAATAARQRASGPGPVRGRDHDRHRASRQLRAIGGGDEADALELEVGVARRLARGRRRSPAAWPAASTTRPASSIGSTRASGTVAPLRGRKRPQQPRQAQRGEDRRAAAVHEPPRPRPARGAHARRPRAPP